MRRLLIALGILTALITNSTAARACGDKLLAFGRGIRFQRSYKTPHPANILVLWRVDPKQPNSGKDIELRSFLTGVGHKVMLVYDPAELAKPMQSQQFDLVVFEIHDEASFDSSVLNVINKPSPIPFLYEPSKAEMKDAQKKYRRVVKVPAKPGQLLAAIDEVMDYRTKRGLATIAKK